MRAPAGCFEQAIAAHRAADPPHDGEFSGCEHEECRQAYAGCLRAMDEHWRTSGGRGLFVPPLSTGRPPRDR